MGNETEREPSLLPNPLSLSSLHPSVILFFRLFLAPNKAISELARGPRDIPSRLEYITTGVPSSPSSFNFIFFLLYSPLRSLRLSSGRFLLSFPLFLTLFIFI